MRLELLEKLGGKCIICNETDSRILHIDHKLGQGYLEKEYFKNNELMYEYYLKHFEVESKYIQILCFNCNIKKRIVNSETRGRPSLRAWVKLVLEYCAKETLVEEEKRFCDENPQFIPILKRILPPLARFFKIETQCRKMEEELEKALFDIPEPIVDCFNKELCCK